MHKHKESSHLSGEEERLLVIGLQTIFYSFFLSMLSSVHFVRKGLNIPYISFVPSYVDGSHAE